MPSEKSPRRPYTSPRRAEAAARTRRAILQAAEELFVAQGYGGTTVDQIAERAGVSKPTVFSSVGSKREILKELRDRAVAGDEEPGPIVDRPWFQEALHEPDPVRALELHARNSVRISARVAAIDEVLRAGAGADPELRELWETSREQRRLNAERFIDALMAKSPLRPGLDHEVAVDLLWMLSFHTHFQDLVRERGWSIPSYEDWLARTLVEQLLPPARLPGKGPRSRH